MKVTVVFHSLVLKAIAVILGLVAAIAILSVAMPSAGPFVFSSVTNKSETPEFTNVDIVVTNLSLRELHLDGLSVSCSCITRPRLPLTVGLGESTTLQFSVEKSKSKQSGDLYVNFMPRSPHAAWRVRLPK